MNGLWESTLGHLRGRLAPETYETWLEPIVYDGLEGSTVRLRIPNRFFADWISARLLPEILESLGEQSGQPGLAVEWVVDPALQEEIPAARVTPTPVRPPEREESRD